MLWVEFSGDFLFLFALDRVKRMDLDGDCAYVSEKHVVCLGRVDSNEFAEAIRHEVDVFQGSPTHLTAVLEVAHVDSAQSPDVELFISHSQRPL